MTKCYIILDALVALEFGILGAEASFWSYLKDHELSKASVAALEEVVSILELANVLFMSSVPVAVEATEDYSKFFSALNDAHSTAQCILFEKKPP